MVTNNDMRRRCAWCRAVLDGRGPILPGEIVTDTICPTCERAMEKRVGLEPIAPRENDR